MNLDRTIARLEALGAEPGKTSPVSRTLSLTVRPAFVAPANRTFVWGDWSAIEARVLPWLAGSRRAEKKLDIFRANDKDPTRPDIYVATACDLIGEDAELWWKRYMTKSDPMHKAAKKLRQAQGKVPELSLGFGGGLGALQAMATNYGVFLDDEAAKKMIDGWRGANGWAKAFWDQLWDAATSAVERPGEAFTAGRVAYMLDDTYMGGTLICGLPSGRTLKYPRIKWEKRARTDKATGKPVLDHNGEPEMSWQLTYWKGYGRSALWFGKCAENATQAEAGSVLRGKLPILFDDCDDWMPVVGHTHDEIVTECDEADEMDARATLLDIMTENDDWNQGLPLAAEITSNWYYSKAND